MLHSRRGQILIPALFVFPSLFLFVYLIYETAKLSREKIRHQFAIDSAAFIEMSNYSDFMNRTAYVNGAFPMRIFHEFDHGGSLRVGPPIEGHSAPAPELNQSDLLSDVYFANGDYPRDPSWTGTGDDINYTAKPQWKIEYCGRDNQNGELCTSPQNGQSIQGPQISMNQVPPDNSSDQCQLGPGSGGRMGPFQNCHMLFDYNTAYAYYVSNGSGILGYSCLDPSVQNGNICQGSNAGTLTTTYVKVYQLLGEVEQAQLDVLTRLAGDHHFLRKSYWLNTSGNGIDWKMGGNAAMVFDRQAQGFFSGFKSVCLNQIAADARSLSETRSQYQTAILGTPEYKMLGAQIYGFGPISPSELGSGGGGPTPCRGGIFQVAYLSTAFVDPHPGGQGSMQQGWYAATSWAMPGKQYWSPGDNFFGKSFASVNPRVCARVTLGESPDPYASVWPDPTPKFQTRLRPCKSLLP